MSETYRIGFTQGDLNGIGPEVLANVLLDNDLSERMHPIVFGSPTHLLAYWKAIGLAADIVDSTTIRLEGRKFAIEPTAIEPIAIDAVASDAVPSFGTIDGAAGCLAGNAIVAAVAHALDGRIDAIVTMPITKEGLNGGGFDYPGHTEMLAELTGGSNPLMVLASNGLRVALLTIHLPIAVAVGSIDQELIIMRARTFEAALRIDWGIERPRIAILGLNPHAGENGMIGLEEMTIYRPAIERLRAEGIDISDPYPADAFFSRSGWDRYDGVVASYHDQGLIPLKMFANGGGVNVTCGLPIVRTSPDHGTAFDIAGKGIADARSAIEATSMAIDIVRNRRRNSGS